MYHWMEKCFVKGFEWNLGEKKKCGGICEFYVATGECHVFIFVGFEMCYSFFIRVWKIRIMQRLIVTL